VTLAATVERGAKLTPLRSRSILKLLAFAERSCQFKVI
jgi:hypothetical protein